MLLVKLRAGEKMAVVVYAADDKHLLVGQQGCRVAIPCHRHIASRLESPCGGVIQVRDYFLPSAGSLRL